MIYELKHSFEYSEDVETKRKKTVKAIEFRRPKGKEAKHVFGILSGLKPLADGGEIPDDLADRVIDFASKFASVVGDTDFPFDMVAGNIDASDIMPLATEIIDNFM